MDGQSFDRLVKAMRTRRSALSLMAGIGAILSVRYDEAAAKKVQEEVRPVQAL